MTRRALDIGLACAKTIGLFALARRLTRNGLRIICYHGFAVSDEYRFRGKLFVRAETLRKRLLYLRKAGYPVVSLTSAVTALRSGRLPPCATVITMDDGWEGVYSKALPVVETFGIPVTIYITTFYIEHRMPVYSVTVSYLFWCSQAQVVRLPDQLGSFDLLTQKDIAHDLAQRYGLNLPPGERYRFLKEMAAALSIPFEPIERGGLFMMLTEEQIRNLAAHGFEIGLHTHRHQWSTVDPAKVSVEVTENRNFLSNLVTQPLRHFCYPSGVFAPHQAPWLRSLGIDTATTLLPGLNSRGTSPFGLKRIVDGETVSDLEFEGEMCGFLELVRAVRHGKLRSVLRSLRISDAAAKEDREAELGSGEKGSDYYDSLHAEHNSADARHLYSKLVSGTIEEITNRKSRSVLEVGCGNGWLAEKILAKTSAQYHGFDFSPVSVSNAAERTRRPELFFVGNALESSSYANFDFDTIVCTEVLEHITDDLDTVSIWPTGTWCICSVPNFDYDGHVRYFSNEVQVAARYGELIDIRSIRKIHRPIIPRGGTRAYLRRLRWSRNDFNRMIGYLGIQSFSRLGGWYLFSGLRR